VTSVIPPISRARGIDAACPGGVTRVPTYDLIIVQSAMAARLAEGPPYAAIEAVLSGTALLSVDVHYRRRIDVALIALHLDARVVTGPLIAQLGAAAIDSGASLIEVPKMDEPARRRLRGQILPTYELVLPDLPSLGDALRLLAAELDLPLPEPEDPGPHSPPADVRFRRGDDWQAGRLCRIGADGAFIATGAPPRVGDIVDLELTAGGEKVLVQAAAVHVTAPHAALALGSVGFGARFLFRDLRAHRVAAPTLTAVTHAVPRVASPPRRRDIRYPVRWPAFVRHGADTVSMKVLDVSRQGLFLETLRWPLSPVMEVILPLDETGGPVRLETRIAREVTADMASARRLSGGVGLEITDAALEDQLRYAGFVNRVARRVERRIVIGAAPRRLAELVGELSAAGYLCTGATDPRDLLQRAIESQRAPDLVLIDETLAAINARLTRRLQYSLGSRHIDSFRCNGEPAATLRALIDAALVM
jgi:hypothetical protein